MKLISAFCAGVLLLWVAVEAQAQIQVQFSQARTLYLQYEPIDLTLTLTNVSDSKLTLNSGTSKSWLSFLVFAQDGSVVNKAKDVDVVQTTLNPGETKEVTINIVPYYAVRSTGGYSVQAIVNIPGLTSIMTGKLYFTVGKGETVWKKDVYVTGEKRTYSLVRFLDVSDANLYLRVEEPDRNLMYTTVKLGKIVAFAEPNVQFDNMGNIHIVQVIGSRNYRYTQADAEGNILHQENRSGVVGMMAPTVVKADDGGVQFVGGYVKKQSTERAKLSETQADLTPTGSAQ